MDCVHGNTADTHNNPDKVEPALDFTELLNIESACFVEVGPLFLLQNLFH